MNLKFLCLMLILPTLTFAKIFRNSYLSFELPDRWKCNLENTEWVCRAEENKEAKEAIIILTAKEVGPTDNFEAYLTHLNSPQQTSFKGAAQQVSKVVYPPKKVQINDQQWIDGLHMASEVPNYFTRYLATIKDRIAVLFTCSAHKDYYSKYSQDFFRAVQSLRVTATKDLAAKPDLGIRPSDGTIGQTIGAAIPGDILNGPSETTEQTGLSSLTKNPKFILIVIAILIGILGVYFLLKSRNDS